LRLTRGDRRDLNPRHPDPQCSPYRPPASAGVENKAISPFRVRGCPSMSRVLGVRRAYAPCEAGHRSDRRWRHRNGSRSSRRVPSLAERSKLAGPAAIPTRTAAPDEQHETEQMAGSGAAGGSASATHPESNVLSDRS
jgi:hypothetical protein